MVEEKQNAHKDAKDQITKGSGTSNELGELAQLREEIKKEREELAKDVAEFKTAMQSEEKRKAQTAQSILDRTAREAKFNKDYPQDMYDLWYFDEGKGRMSDSAKDVLHDMIVRKNFRAKPVARDTVDKPGKKSKALTDAGLIHLFITKG